MIHKMLRIADPYSLLTRQSALVFKVGVSYGWKMTKCVASYSQGKAY